MSLWIFSDLLLYMIPSECSGVQRFCPLWLALVLTIETSTDLIRGFCTLAKQKGTQNNNLSEKGYILNESYDVLRQLASSSQDWSTLLGLWCSTPFSQNRLQRVTGKGSVDIDFVGRKGVDEPELFDAIAQEVMRSPSSSAASAPTLAVFLVMVNNPGTELFHRNSRTDSFPHTQAEYCK